MKSPPTLYADKLNIRFITSHIVAAGVKIIQKERAAQAAWSLKDDVYALETKIKRS